MTQIKDIFTVEQPVDGLVSTSVLRAGNGAVYALAILQINFISAI